MREPHPPGNHASSPAPVATGDLLGKIRVAVIQAAPLFLDRAASTDKACSLIDDAADKEANVIVFPEGFIPTHPVWFHFHSATSAEALEMSAALFRNSVVVGSETTDQIAEAARRAEAWVVLGICEKEADTTGTMWNSSITFAPDGEIVKVHRKLTPTVGERLVHAGGHSNGLGAAPAPFGKISSLLCAENSNPLLVHTVLSEYAVLHAALWPNHFSPTQPRMRDVILNSSRALAYQAGCYVLNAASTLDGTMRGRIPRTEEDRAWLSDPDNLGGSCIVAPGGEVLAGPAPGDEESILIADLDLDAIATKKVIHDYAGHYNRPDVLRLVVEPPPGDDTGMSHPTQTTTSPGRPEEDAEEGHDA